MSFLPYASDLLVSDSPSQSAAMDPVQQSNERTPNDLEELLRRAESLHPDLVRRSLVFGITHQAVLEKLHTSWRM